MTQFYIGTKLVQAWREDRCPAGETVEGYGVRYSDGYTSWAPKSAFEAAYLALPEDSDGSAITQETVLSMIVSWSDFKLCEKTTAVTATLRNGFEITETSSCVAKHNYDHAIGVQLCRAKVIDKVWMLLGFMLQTARDGIGTKAA